jgi:argininosuccinate lyase
LALLKGLPLAYNKDLQLDKEPIFRLNETLGLTLSLLTVLVKNLKLNRERMHQTASSENFFATSMADWLAVQGLPFRQAHKKIGRWLVEKNKTGRNVSAFNGDTKSLNAETLTIEKILAQKHVLGGTSPVRVKAAARTTLKRIQKLQRSN